MPKMTLHNPLVLHINRSFPKFPWKIRFSSGEIHDISFENKHLWTDIRSDISHTYGVRPRQRTCFPFFMPRKSFNKPFVFLFKTNRLHFSVCVYCNRSQKTSHHVNNNSHATQLRLVLYFLFFTRCDFICDLLQYTRTVYLLNI